MRAESYQLMTAAVAIIAFAWISAPCAAVAQTRWEDDIRAFEKEDRRNPPPDDPILFVGSSSILGWTTLEDDFAGMPVINRGFGGSQLTDVIHYAHRIVVPYGPRLIVLYEGDNDIASGKSPEDVFRDFRRFAALVHNRLPETRIAFISIKPSLARWEMADEMRDANALIETYASRREYLDYIDVFEPMLGEDGSPLEEIFLEDGLHMNEKGYAIWKDAVEPFLKPR